MIRRFDVSSGCQRSGATQDWAFYPDKKKGPGAVVNGQESYCFTGTAGHWRDQGSTFMKKIQMSRQLSLIHIWRTLKNPRLEQIIQLLQQQGTVSVSQLSEIFQVTTKTIRRDLELLESEGELLRTHGGAQLVKEDILREKPLELRLNIEADKKKRMGLKATGLIEHGQKIFIGAGSSLYHFTAVSYTHLDVYKRQYQGWPASRKGWRHLGKQRFGALS